MMHEVAEAVPTYLPAAQSRQMVAPLADHLPATQGLIKVVIMIPDDDDDDDDDE